MDKLTRMKELAAQLREASRAYYAEDRELMSNFTYDQLYAELQALEAETGVVLADSPTLSVGYEAVDFLPKEAHDQPMLSLDKTKDVEELAAFIGDQKTLLSWKLDGLTVVLTYRNGALFKAVTRGNGTIGEVVTNNARTFVNLPGRIPYTGELILRGEAVITYPDFERINAQLPEGEAQYKNPRNLCSGAVRQLNNEITAQRSVRFFAFALVRADGVDFENSREKQFLWLKEQGFEVVEYRVVTGGNTAETVRWFADRIADNEFPSDGLVALYDDIAYGDSLGATAKFPRNAFAFKWADEIRTTRLLEIEWSPSRTGLLNPVAIFEPVELEGTTVSRASVHNLSIVRELALAPGDEIEVYKANMIIPQIAENLTRSGAADPPDTCPACGGPTSVNRVGDVETLICENPDCPAKAMKAYTLFVSRDALNIDGLSEATLSKFMAHGMIRSYADIFRLDRFRDTIVGLDGFGEKSYEKLQAAAGAAKETTLSRLLYGMGIPNIGLATAKLISRAFDEDPQRVTKATEEELAGIEGIGPVIARAYTDWWKKEANARQYADVLQYLDLHREFQGEEAQDLAGKIFVITGSLVHFANRGELKERIEQRGGKVTGSVSANTDYLINNDVTSGSSKNKKARELGIPILSEDDLLAMMGGDGPAAEN